MTRIFFPLQFGFQKGKVHILFGDMWYVRKYGNKAKVRKWVWFR